MYVLKDLYFHYVNDNKLEQDSEQLKLIALLGEYKKSIEENDEPGFFSKVINIFKSNLYDEGRGVYVWGEVGRGKSMIMDLFFNNLKTAKKQRLHFHKFIKGVHDKLKQLRQDETYYKMRSKDFITVIANELSENFEVIYLDELQINNIADAMIVGRLFSALIANGVYVFFTSNRAPDDLFKDGLQRDRFLQFIDLIKTKLDVFYLNNLKDYRIEKLDREHLYFYPLNKNTEEKISEIIYQLTERITLNNQVIKVDENRELLVHNCYGHMAVFTFRELCEVPLGAIDYIALCHHFNLFIIKNIPKLNDENHNEALRFITLIDCLYESKAKLICSAATKADELYLCGKNSFEFARTISRLNEMQTKTYFDQDKV